MIERIARSEDLAALRFRRRLIELMMSAGMAMESRIARGPIIPQPPSVRHSACFLDRCRVAFRGV